MSTACTYTNMYNENKYGEYMYTTVNQNFNFSTLYSGVTHVLHCDSVVTPPK